MESTKHAQVTAAVPNNAIEDDFQEYNRPKADGGGCNIVEPGWKSLKRG
jgi:hypothetical protein